MHPSGMVVGPFYFTNVMSSTFRWIRLWGEQWVGCLRGEQWLGGQQNFRQAVQNNWICLAVHCMHLRPTTCAASYMIARQKNHKWLFRLACAAPSSRTEKLSLTATCTHEQHQSIFSMINTNLHNAIVLDLIEFLKIVRSVLGSSQWAQLLVSCLHTSLTLLRIEYRQHHKHQAIDIAPMWSCFLEFSVD